METLSSRIKWTSAKKLLFLFFGAYFVIGIFPFPIGFPPFFQLEWFYTDFMDWLVALVGRLFFSIPSFFKPVTDWSDNIYVYTYCFTLSVLATLFATIVFIFFRNKINFDRWFDFTRTYLRYYLGLVIIFYGLVKVGGSQFSELQIVDLEQEYGDSTRHALLWNFMRASQGYVWFTAALQIIGGYLLFFRKTLVLGCLVIIAVMTNIVMINIFYDVSVKLFSTHLLLLAILIVIPDSGGMFRFFILHQPALLADTRLVFSKKYLRIGRVIVKSLFIVGVPVTLLIMILDLPVNNRLATPQGWEGSYKTELFVWEGDTLAPEEKRAERWRKFIVQNGGALIMRENNMSQEYKFSVDTVQQTAMFMHIHDSTLFEELSYTWLGPKLTLKGDWKGHPVFARFTRKRKNEFPLMDEETHWD